MEDNLAYFFDYGKGENGGGKFVFRNCMDSRLNFLANVNVSYASFLIPEKIGEDKLLVAIKGNFFIFKPNGEIIKQVDFEIPDDTFPSDLELEVEDVSDSLEFFIFKDVASVFRLVKTDEADTYKFKFEQYY